MQISDSVQVQRRPARNGDGAEAGVPAVGGVDNRVPAEAVRRDADAFSRAREHAADPVPGIRPRGVGSAVPRARGSGVDGDRETVRDGVRGPIVERELQVPRRVGGRGHDHLEVVDGEGVGGREAAAEADVERSGSDRGPGDARCPRSCVGDRGAGVEGEGKAVRDLDPYSISAGDERAVVRRNDR